MPIVIKEIVVATGEELTKILSYLPQNMDITINRLCIKPDDQPPPPSPPPQPLAPPIPQLKATGVKCDVCAQETASNIALSGLNGMTIAHRSETLDIVHALAPNIFGRESYTVDIAFDITDVAHPNHIEVNDGDKHIFKSIYELSAWSSTDKLVYCDNCTTVKNDIYD